MRYKTRREAPGILLGTVLCLLGPNRMLAQNPVPQISQPLVPASAAPGGPGFTITIRGTGFTSSSVVNWNGNARASNYLRSTELTAMILASDIAVRGTALVTVTNPPPGGGTSNVNFFQVTAPTSSVSFNRSDYPLGTSPDTVVSGDVNGDGVLDLVLANSGGRSVSVLLGNGDGTFQPSVSYATGGDSRLAVMGDFNGDGKVDLAVANGYAGTVSMLLGNGDGTFQDHRDYATGGDAVCLVAGDFNGDGKLDLAVLDELDGTVSVLLGNGDGTFQTHVDYSAGMADPLSLAIGDFNGDGKLDLVVAGGNGDGVSILLGNGDGTFQPSLGYTPTSMPVSVAPADFDGDGKLDLVLGTDAVSIVLGNGDGTFGSEHDYPPTTPGSGPYRAAPPGDFNGDGRLDVVVANQGDNSLSMWLGNGNGTLQPQTDYATMPQPYSLATGDFNGDGRLDLAVVYSADNIVSILLQCTEVTLSPPRLTFGSQAIGTTSASQTVTFTNTSSRPLTISSIAASLDYAQSSNCGSSLGSGANCTISVTFNPSASGLRTGTVTISDDAADSPQAVALSGTGGDFSIGVASGSSDSATVVAGQTATYTVSVTPANGFTQAVSLACAGAPSAATCSISPSLVTLNGSSATNATVTVSTTAPSSLAPRPDTGPSTLGSERVVLLSLWALVLALGLVMARQRQPRLFLGAALLVTVLWVSCGGGGGGGGGAGGNPGTPQGTYTLTVTGSYTSGSNTLSHSISLTLKVD